MICTSNDAHGLIVMSLKLNWITSRGLLKFILHSSSAYIYIYINQFLSFHFSVIGFPSPKIGMEDTSSAL